MWDTGGSGRPSRELRRLSEVLQGPVQGQWRRRYRHWSASLGVRVDTGLSGPGPGRQHAQASSAEDSESGFLSDRVPYLLRGSPAGEGEQGDCAGLGQPSRKLAAKTRDTTGR